MTCFFHVLFIDVLSGAEKPNILVILADDLGYGDLKSFNPDSKNTSPNLDQLAREGMIFTNAHSCGSVCIQSRYALITGRYPFRMKSYRWRKQSLIDEDRLTLPKLLKQNGYMTAAIGKWHLGFNEGNLPPISPVLHGGPVDRGFDYYFGIPGSLDQPPYYYIRNQNVVSLPVAQVKGNNSVTEGWTRFQGAFWREGGIAPGLKHENVLPDLTDETLKWLDGYGKSEKRKPFFLYFAMTAPHTPWLPLGKFKGKSSTGSYGDFVTQVDDSIGRVLEMLDQHDLKKNTLVIVTSDNGPMWHPQDVKKYQHQAAGPYRGMKGDSWEGGHRVPFFVRWPGEVPKGKTSSQLQCHADIYLTCTAAAGIKPPGSIEVDSNNMLAIWKGNMVKKPIRETFISQSSGKVLAIQKGDWKLIPILGSGGFTKPSRRKPEPGEPIGQLYYLTNDPAEKNNLYHQHPEIVKTMLADLKKIQNSIQPPQD